MKRFHLHLSVADLDQNIQFYSSLFNSQPKVLKEDYAKWELNEPRINFAISTRGKEVGLDHLGFQVDSDEELQALRKQLSTAELPLVEQSGAVCCYAKSDKYWTEDPQGIAWESFNSLEEAAMFNEVEAESACCTPKPESKKSCC